MENFQMLNNLVATSKYRCTSISIGKAKKPSSDGRLAEFLILSYKDASSFISATKKVIIFDDDVDPTMLEALKAIGKPSVRHQGGLDVSIAEFKQSDLYNEDPEMWQSLLFLQGAMVQRYKFKKGLCYANDADGNRTLDKYGQPIVKDGVDVLVQIKALLPTTDGNVQTIYVDPFSLEKQGSRFEDRFFRVPANTVQNVAPEAPTTPVAPTSQVPDNQAVTAPQNNVGGGNFPTQPPF